MNQRRPRAMQIEAHAATIRCRRGEAPAAHFLALSEAQGVHAALSAEGFDLSPVCRPRPHGNHLSVALVWRRPSGDEQCILRLRLRLPRDPADG